MLANRMANVLARRRVRKGLTSRTSLTPWWKRLSTVEESKIYNGYMDGVEGIPQWKFDTTMERESRNGNLIPSWNCGRIAVHKVTS
jgi:hypothetical protein